MNKELLIKLLMQRNPGWLSDEAEKCVNQYLRIEKIIFG